MPACPLGSQLASAVTFISLSLRPREQNKAAGLVFSAVRSQQAALANVLSNHVRSHRLAERVGKTLSLLHRLNCYFHCY